MKRIMFILIALGLLVSLEAIGQVVWMKTDSFTFRDKIVDSEWSEWAEWVPSDIDVRLDFTSDEIIIYSPEVQTYDILYYEYLDEKNEDKGYILHCLDSDQLICILHYVAVKHEPGVDARIYVFYDDIEFCYNLYYN